MPPDNAVVWGDAVRIIRSRYPPIDLFEDVADPEDWPLLIAAEQKTNPRLMESVGNLDLVPPDRRVSGHGASYLMAPFTHVSRDRPSRYSDGSYGVLYAADRFSVALAETILWHSRFMAATAEPPGWTSQFREILLDVKAVLHDLRGEQPGFAKLRLAMDYGSPQRLGATLRTEGSQGVVYPSVRAAGDCVGLFYPDLASNPRQGRHLDYHWNGEIVDYYREPQSRKVYRVG